MGEPQGKRRKTTTSPEPPDPRSIDEEPSTVGPDDTVSEEASYASLMETALLVCLQENFI